MTSPRSQWTRRLVGVLAMTIAFGLTAGCDEQASADETLRNFVIDFARQALAAFLL